MWTNSLQVCKYPCGLAVVSCLLLQINARTLVNFNTDQSQVKLGIATSCGKAVRKVYGVHLE